MARRPTPDEQALCKTKTKQLYDELAAVVRKFTTSWPAEESPMLLIQVLLLAISRISGDAQRGAHVMEMPLPIMLLTCQQGIEQSEDQPNFRLLAYLKDLAEAADAAEAKYAAEHPEEAAEAEQAPKEQEAAPTETAEGADTGKGTGKIHVEELPDCGRPHCTIHGTSEQALQRRKGLYQGQA
jgi:hypothetical protein